MHRFHSINSAMPAMLRILILLMLALAMAGCATVHVSEAPASAQAPAFATASALAANHAAYSGQAKADNAREIQRLLATLDDATLMRDAAALPAGDPLYAFAARALLDRGLPLPRPLDAVGVWQILPGSRPPADIDGYQPPTKLALLLPLTGNLARAAAPVRDGFLAGYYGETRRRPEITFYDTHGTSGGAIAAYESAVAAGNDFVVGPLSRDAVAAVFSSTSLSVPILALNRALETPPPGHASFSLSPEDEGIAAAEFLLQRGARQVLVIAANDDSMRRAATAFKQRFSERGGNVVDTLGVGSAVEVLGPQLAKVAQAPGGVDAIFLALNGRKARMLVPQLPQAGLSGAALVATSELMSGTGDPEQDRLLDGIAYPTETWYVHGIAGLPPARSLGERLPTARGGAAKLFAFGHDAWLLTAYPGVAASGVEGGLRGATGRLSIDSFGNVLRTPTWSTFSNGHPVPLAPMAVDNLDRRGDEGSF